MVSQLLVLGLGCGENFPCGSSEQKVQVRACLGETWLTSCQVPVTSRPEFNTELVWETNKDQLRSLRSRKANVKLEVMVGDQRIGHLNVGVRTAVPFSKNSQTHGPNLVIERLISQISPAPNLEICLSLFKKELGRSGPTVTEVEGGGYFQIGETDEDSKRFSLAVSIEKFEHLDQLLAPGLQLKPQVQFYFHYQLVETDIFTTQFVSLDQFESETATAKLYGNDANILDYLSSTNIRLRLCCDSIVVATTTDINLGSLPTNTRLDQEISYRDTLDVRSEQVEGKTGKLTIYIRLILGWTSSSPPLKDNSSIDLSITQKSEGLSVLNQSEGLSVTQQSDMGLSEGPLHTTDDSEKVDSKMETDCSQMTEYQSPPKQYTGTPQVKPFKFSVELKSVLLTNQISCQDLVLVYKYTALHPKCITTEPGFYLLPNHLTSVPRGYTQFNFTVAEKKLEKTFSSHPLKVGLYEAGHKVGAVTVPLTEVLDKCSSRGLQTWTGKVDILTNDGDIIGSLEVQLELEDCEVVGRVEVSKRMIDGRMEIDLSNRDLLMAGKMGINQPKNDMLAGAAKEVERWKMEQKQIYSQKLKQEENNHLTILGREWRDREVEREKVYRQRLEKVKSMEEELKRELDLVTAKRSNVEAKTKELELEKSNMGKEKDDVKEEKGLLINKLKFKLKELEAALSNTNFEKESLSKQLTVAKSDLAERDDNKRFRKEKEQTETSELTQLRSEEKIWQSKLDQSDKEKKFYVDKCQMLQLEVDKLRQNQDHFYNGQISRLEHQVKDLSHRLFGQSQSSQVEEEEPPIQPSNNNQEHQSPIRISSLSQVDSRVRSKESQTIPKNDTSLTLSRLEENKNMLLRTGVYKESDYLLLQLTNKINKLKSQTDGDGLGVTEDRESI